MFFFLYSVRHLFFLLALFVKKRLVCSHSCKNKTMTNLKSLANGLLPDLFQYLSIVDLLNAFQDINYCFTLTPKFTNRSHRKRTVVVEVK
jgi:hypothetical protein